jgi:uncharacterized repeat protein (TIGR03803 family)
MFADQARSSSQRAMGSVRPNGLVWLLALVAFGCACADTPSVQAQTFTTLYTFLGAPDGAYPSQPLIRDTAGNLYGVTPLGGDSTNCDRGCGTAFELSSNGVETVLYSFQGPDGAGLTSGLVRDAAGNLYGATGGDGGAAGWGSIFKLDKEGNELLLYSFTGGADGGSPQGPLMLDSAGNIYGTAQAGGTNPCANKSLFQGCGTVFVVSPTGVESVLYSFKGGADGATPVGGLVRDTAGNFYGTTEYGGNPICTFSGIHGCGTIFRLTSAGVKTVLYRFAGYPTDGEAPASLIFGAGRNLYGTTVVGGTYDGGTAFEVTLTGTEKFLYSFSNDEEFHSGLTADGAGSFYGTTNGGIFKITNDGVETLFYSFGTGCGGSYATLIKDGSGNFYGTTPNCGVYGVGTVFEFTP